MKFLDEAKVYVAVGRRRNGCIAFRREKFIEFGGPSGGDGGKAATLDRGGRRPQHADRLPLPAAPRGQEWREGHGKGLPGRHGKDAVLKVPIGTQVFEEDGETLLADFATSANA